MGGIRGIVVVAVSALAVAGGAPPGSAGGAMTGPAQVWAFGDNFRGQLGNGTNTNSNVPVPVIGQTHIVHVDGGGRS
jgi:alpha-tubulin suppressor-like RCC1 family protein